MITVLTEGKPLKTILLIIFNVLLLVSGQILWKIGLDKIGGVTMENSLRILFSPFILAGLLLYLIATVVWFMVLSRAELSYAYPLQSTAYVLGVIAAWVLFKEVIPPVRWIGVSVMVVGAALISYK